MKKYIRRIKPEKVSKRMLVSRAQAAQEEALQSKHEVLRIKDSLKRVQDSLGLEVVRSAGYCREAEKLREELEKLTEPVWRHARVSRTPSEPEAFCETWSLDGVCCVAIQANISGVRCLPRRDREAFLERLVEDFTRKAREHAKKSFRVLGDEKWAY